MNRATALPLLVLAHEALRREPPNIELARGILKDVVGTSHDAIERSEPRADEAVGISEAARRMGYSPRHVRTLIKRRALGDAVIGSGRATRIVVARALDALRSGTPTASNVSDDEIADGGARWARRSRLRVVEGGK